MMGPRISIALCTYNGEKFLPQQLESLFRQTQLPLELQVGDERSTDDTLDVLNEFGSRSPFPFNVTVNPTKLGYGENFIQTAQRCLGEWIAFCDHDDVWLPHKLERCAQLISGGPADLMAVAHEAVVIDEYGVESGSLFGLSSTRLHARWTLQPPWMWHGCCFVFRRELITDISPEPRSWPWSPKGQPDAHDAWVPVIASAVGAVIISDEQLVQYRRHAMNYSPFWSPEPVGKRLLSTLKSNAASHKREAQKLARLAELFEYHSKNTRRGDWSHSLREASQELVSAAEMFEQRADAYTLPCLSSRLAALWKLLRSGSYSKFGRWGFGRKSLIKDLVYAITPKFIKTDRDIGD